MESNHNSTVKQTLQSAMENDQHLSLSDSGSVDSDTDNPIVFSSPTRFHSASDSDESTEYPTHKESNPISTTAHSSSPPKSDDSAKSEAHKARNTNATSNNRDSTCPQRSSISSDSDDFTQSRTDKARNASTKVESPARSSISSDLDDSKKFKANKARNTNSIPATINGDSTKVESPARSSISSDHISLPRNSLENNKPSASPTGSPPEKPPPVPETVVKRSIKEEPLALVKADLFVGDGADSVKEGGDGGSNRRRRGRPELSILRKAKRDEAVKKAALGFRIFGVLFCLVSFSVMAADRTKGWALDSFERYKEFRYCISVNVIGFVYSGAQAFDLAYQFATGKNIMQHHLRYMFDFALDQVVTYLLISASSSAATRIDDWQSNWGKDKFPDMASASVAMSFLAFAALAFSSLISGYVLCNSRST